MNERKKLDKLFQEKFKNFEIAPPENAWQNIEIKLKEKEKKRRITPFWWKFSTVAALLALLLMIFQNYDIKITKKGENAITNFNENLKKQKVEKANFDLKTIKKQTEIVNIEKELKNKPIKKSKIIDKSIIEIKSSLVKTRVNNSEKNEILAFKEKEGSKIKKLNSDDTIDYKNKLKSEKFINSNIKNHIVSSNKKEYLYKSKKIITNSSFAVNNSENKKTIKIKDLKNKIDVIKIDLENESDKVAFSKKLNSISDKNIVDEINKYNSKLNLETSKIKKNDSTRTAMVDLNTLEKLLIEKELKKKEPKLNRWQITSNVAPIYFSSSSNDSPLDSKFNNNKKEFASNNGAGLGINYAVTKKIKIRTGINLLSMSYSTKDVVFYETPINDRLNNLNPNAIGSKMQIENLNIIQSTKVDGKISDFEIPNPKNINGASLNQKIGYVEVPLEMAYKIVDKKFSIDLIGGMSTFYLRENTVSLKSNSVEMEIGEAKNLNKFHYSGNIGIGFKYAFLKHFEAAVEPIYKYQVNTFTNTDLNFRPNSFGIYSGINYHF